MLLLVVIDWGRENSQCIQFASPNIHYVIPHIELTTWDTHHVF